MRWLLAKILWLPKAAGAILVFVGLYQGWRTGWPDVTKITIAGGFLWLFTFEYLQQRLLRRRPAVPKAPTPVYRPLKASPPPAEPSKPKPRRFASVPVATSAAPTLEIPAPGLPGYLERFIALGDQAIYAPPPPPRAPAPVRRAPPEQPPPPPMPTRPEATE